MSWKVRLSRNCTVSPFSGSNAWAHFCNQCHSGYKLRGGRKYPDLCGQCARRQGQLNRRPAKSLKIPPFSYV